ncbi:MAG: glycosyltransferase family 2 protein [Euryarchaeota archaeon]|nr:glycosyltransferase family 2 protein [Euryarchaeota archaeon]
MKRDEKTSKEFIVSFDDPGTQIRVKICVLSIFAIVIVLTIYGFVTGDITWLQCILAFLAIYSIIITVTSIMPSLKPERTDLKPFVSIIIPAHNEENTIERCVRSTATIDYVVGGIKNYEVVVVDDGSTDRTPETLKKLEKRYSFLKVVTRIPPDAGKGKGYALNDGLRVCRGGRMVVLDADAKVDSNFLSKAIPYLNMENVAGIQPKVRMHNASQNMLTSLQDDEFATFNKIIQKGRDILDGATALGGNGQITTRRIMEAVGGWTNSAVTEDLDLSIKLLLNGWRIRYCDETVIYQEAVPTWRALFKQRVRWAEGHLESFFVFGWAIITAKNIPLSKKFDIFLYLSGINMLFFIMLSYFYGIIQMGFFLTFSSKLPSFVWILSSLAFFPAVIIGLYLEIDRRPHIIIYRTIRFWLYCLHWIPVLFVACIKLIIRKERKWDKTHHTGE